MPSDYRQVLIKHKNCNYWEVARYNSHYEVWDDSEGDEYLCDKEDVELWFDVPKF